MYINVKSIICQNIELYHKNKSAQHASEYFRLYNKLHLEISCLDIVLTYVNHVSQKY